MKNKNAQNTQVYKQKMTAKFSMFKMNRVEELFNLVEEEFTADQEDALTLLNTKTSNLTRENTSERLTFKSNRWPKPKAVIEFAKKLEEKEAMEVATEVSSCSLS